MKRQYLIAILALLLPALVRGLWFYHGLPSTRPEISTPDYASFTRPQVAVSTPDLENVQELGGTVLIDGYHGNQFMLNEIDSFTNAIRLRGGTVETVTDSTALELQLKSASAFVTISPSVTFSPYEALLLKKFADRGGRILVFADATRISLYYDYISGNPIAYGDANAANSLLKQFDISINSDYLYNTKKNEGNFRNVLFDKFGKSELTFGLSEVALYGTRSVESTSGLVLLQGTSSTLSSSDDAHNPNAGGAVLSADGNVAAFGDFTFLSTPYNTYTDNATLIQNLADFALSSERTPSLTLFPYLFTQQTVQVYLAPDIEKTPEVVTALGSLQSAMSLLNLKVEFVDKLPSSGDTIIIGLFDSTDDFDVFLKRADVEINDQKIDTVTFGEVVKSGNGLVLFDAGKKGNTLVLLTNTTEDAISLLGVMGYGTLDSCLMSDNVAVCSVGYSDYSSDAYSEDTYSDSSGTGDTTTTETVEPTPEAQPTPSG